MTRSARAIARSIFEVSSALSKVPLVHLGRARRKRLSGHLFEGADEVVGAVARALIERPDLFPGVPLCGAELLARQEEAAAYRCLHAALTVLCEEVHDSLVATQAAAARDAMDVLRHARGLAASPFPDGREGERSVALLGAEQALAERQRRISRTARERKRPPGLRGMDEPATTR